MTPFVVAVLVAASLFAGGTVIKPKEPTLGRVLQGAAVGTLVGGAIGTAGGAVTAFGVETAGAAVTTGAVLGGSAGGVTGALVPAHPFDEGPKLALQGLGPPFFSHKGYIMIIDDHIFHLEMEVETLRNMLQPHDIGHINTAISVLNNRIDELRKLKIKHLMKKLNEEVGYHN